MPTTIKEIICDSFKKQQFNQKEKYPQVTAVFDELIWNEESLEKWFSQQELIKIINKLSHKSITGIMVIETERLKEELG